MELQQRLSLTAGILLIISGCTHLTQLTVYQHHGHVIAASLFGVVYLLPGVFIIILMKKTWAIIPGAIVPFIGGTPGVMRFFFVHANPFSVFHVLLDLMIVPFCIASIILSRKE